MYKKDCVAMLLAGGQGSRLGALTRNLAKPAVPFGGKYRIIDFTLSNCYNSGIDTVGVLTQYRPLELNSYIGIGSAWNLDRKNGGVYVLPPFVKEDGGEWYKGTADAVYQNLAFLDRFQPDYVLVLSGDHIYHMDYSDLLEHHISCQAEATIACIEVPWPEASRFGIMNTGTDYHVVEFEEKPASPKNNLASMGIYVFNASLLRRYLEADANDENSQHDFGRNIIPHMLADYIGLYAYPFQGYWKDVGTVESYWEASMDLLTGQTGIDSSRWPVFSVDPAQPPHFISASGEVANSIIGEGCIIHGVVERSILFPGVIVGEQATVRDAVLMPNSVVEAQACIERAILGQRARISSGCSVRPAEPSLVDVIDDDAVVERRGGVG